MRTKALGILNERVVISSQSTANGDSVFIEDGYGELGPRSARRSGCGVHLRSGKERQRRPCCPKKRRLQPLEPAHKLSRFQHCVALNNCFGSKTASEIHIAGYAVVF